MTVSSVDSVQVRVHLYERNFPAKPVRRVLADELPESDAGSALGNVTDGSAVLPDDNDIHLGRERPPLFKRLNLDRRVAEGVAHAPDASFTAADGRADCVTGGTERRPLRCNEVVQAQGHSRIDVSRNHVDAIAR